MNVYTDISKIECKKGTVVSVGTFDVVHAGHRKLIGKMLSLASENNLSDILITFNPHPRNVVSKFNKISILTSLNEKLTLIEKLGVGNVFVINFNEEFMQTPYEEFIVDFLVNKLNLKYLIIGHDHKFGKNREGDESKLKLIAEKYNFEVISISSIDVDGDVVSSTKIRKHLIAGEIESVNKYLQDKYIISGKVVRGAQRGRQLGYPTINIEPEEDKLLPKRGVYAVSCLIENKVYFGMMNIGNRPTFENLEKSIIEVNLFRFNKEIYDQNVTVEIYDFIRDEVKFNNMEDLKIQLKIDKDLTENYFNFNN